MTNLKLIKREALCVFAALVVFASGVNANKYNEVPTEDQDALEMGQNSQAQTPVTQPQQGPSARGSCVIFGQNPIKFLRP
ncbi:MAG: hypothetical protein Q8S21_06865 [Candidatus Paracaedibacteraceae bacterium]|nr:hypothetical protein [Candidatus Paracaedibacteraceae bacterium]